MNLRINAQNPRLIEDEFGNPMFEFKGTHLGDIEWLMNKLYNNPIETLALDAREKIDDAQLELQGALNKLNVLLIKLNK
jgi:hypothetical protein